MCINLIIIRTPPRLSGLRICFFNLNRGDTNKMFRIGMCMVTCSKYCHFPYNLPVRDITIMRPHDYLWVTQFDFNLDKKVKNIAFMNTYLMEFHVCYIKFLF